MGIAINLSDLKEIYYIIPEKYRIHVIISVIFVIFLWIFYKYREFISIFFKTIYLKINRFLNFIKLLPRLWTIGVENSQNYKSSLIHFNINRDNFLDSISSFQGIIAGNNIVRPHLKFRFSITNYSIFDFKIQKVAMRVLYHNSDLNLITNEGITFDEAKSTLISPGDLLQPLKHQRTIYGEAKCDLSQKCIDQLKKELKEIEEQKKEKLLNFKLSEVELYFTGDKEFRWTWAENRRLEIPVKRIDVS